MSVVSSVGASACDPPEVPEAVMEYAVRRVYLSAFFRQAEDFFSDVGRAYLDAFVYYFGLGRPGPVG